ncbi:C4-dicarboxylate ABC transporter [Tropicimonas sp. TH_r6]|uniref:TRAP transporter substrate-binding protein n=1 Tax=Tropicimonas sp. TH_r6 TaxID=3082085 RepID=UPI002954B856|nr:C4-dicarboxylate ABC transporter [Tropicimonas sp. TH_r6]MDV7141787.1 C4-dicarboxylate ABC transporter [Tropicimonas sp. TH_r6]
MMSRILAACTLLIATAVHAEDYLDIVSSYHHDLPVYGEQSTKFVESFNEISPNLKFRHHDPGKLVPASQALEAVASGQVDAAFSVSGYWWDRMPAAILFASFPFDFDPSGRLAWLLEGNGSALYQEMYARAGYDVTVLPCGLNPGETSGWFREEVTSVEDLAGLKIRMFGLGGQVMEKLGVETRPMLADELSYAIKTGELDGAEFGTIAADVFLGLHETANFAYFPSWHQPTGTTELLVNRAVWDGLAGSERRAMEIVCMANITANLANGAVANARAYNEVKKEGRVEFRTWPPDVLIAIRGAWDELVEEKAARDPFFATVWEDIKAFNSERKGWLAVSTSQN